MLLKTPKCRCMMLEREKVLDDIAKLAGGTISALSGLNTQIREEIRARIDEAAMRLDLVPREEFEKLETMLTRAREEQEQLVKRVEQLENKIKGSGK